MCFFFSLRIFIFLLALFRSPPFTKQSILSSFNMLCNVFFFYSSSFLCYFVSNSSLVLVACTIFFIVAVTWSNFPFAQLQVWYQVCIDFLLYQPELEHGHFTLSYIHFFLLFFFRYQMRHSFYFNVVGFFFFSFIDCIVVGGNCHLFANAIIFILRSPT